MPNKRLLAGAAALLMLLPLASCGQKETPDQTSASDTESAETTTTSAPLSFEGVDFGGREFHILLTANGPDTVNDFETSEMIGETLSNAVEKRKAQVEEAVGVSLITKTIFKYGNHGYNELYAGYTAGDTDYDAAVVAAYDVVPLAYTNALYNLYDLDKLDISNPWWDARATEELTVMGQMYFTTGDITFWDDMMQYCVAFNKEMWKNYNRNDIFGYSPYELVERGEWTYEAMATLAKGVTEDIDNSGTYDMSDRYGILTWDDTVYGVLNSAGQKVITRDENGRLALSLTEGNETAIDALTKYTDICFGGDAVNYQRFSGGENDMFIEDRALFFLTRLSVLSNYRDKETDYGILPFPKYSADQDRYYTTPSPYHMNFVCVPSVCEDPDMSAAVLEALGYYGRETVTPAYYEATLTGQYFRDEESEKMLSLLAESRCYDIGFYVQPDNINKELIYLFRPGNYTFASTFASHYTAASKRIEQINLMFEQIAANK